MLKIAAILLVSIGLINSIPSVGAYLTELAGGTPVVQSILGIAALLVGLGLLVQREASASHEIL